MALIAQLTQERSSFLPILGPLYYKYSDGPSLPSVQALKEILLSILLELTDSYVILDGIDECSNIEEALGFLTFLHARGLKGLHIMVTSRRRNEIDATFLNARFGSSAIHTVIDSLEGKEKAIEIFIMHELETRSYFRKFSAELKAYILDVLSKRSEGMFVFSDLSEINNNNLFHSQVFVRSSNAATAFSSYINQTGQGNA